MIEGKNIDFKYALEEIYIDASFRILNKEHAVLVGPNGAGKTTLMKMIAKLISPDKGEVTYLDNINVGYLDQYMSLDNNVVVSDYIYNVFNDLFKKEKEMLNYYDRLSDQNLTQTDSEKYLNYAASIQDYLMDNNFYALKSQISNIVHGLGLSMDVLDLNVSQLSSGMRSKIILAKLLLEKNDFILLDEPTNFLDKEHVTWLTKFLKEYDNAFLVISHNEEFLKEIADVVLAVENKKVSRYKGNYEFYLKERVLRIDQANKNYESQQKFIKETETFINKNIVRASTTKRAQSRRKMLEKIVRVDKVKADLKYHFSFPIKTTTGKEVLKVTDLLIGYNDTAIIDKQTLVIRNGEKVVITGKNGIGKSTLVKTITGDIKKIAGEIIWDKNTKISYLKQDDFYQLTETAFQVVANVYNELDNKQVYNLLATYGISYEMANREISTLSGGEQTKIKIALLKNNFGNVLIMDEPTNHLDVNAKLALKEALISYKGTLILVSHEKEFYEDVCDYEISLF